MDQKTMQQKAMQREMYREQAKQAQQEIMRLESQAQELEMVKESAHVLENEKAGSDVLIPVGAGIFIPGKIGSTKELLVSVGAGVVVKKTVPETVAFLDDKINLVKKAIADIKNEVQKIGAAMQSVSGDM